MAVDTHYQDALRAIREQVKARIELVLEEQGLTHVDLAHRLGYSTPSGYWKMYSVGTLDLRKVARIAAILNVDPETILLGTASPVRQPRPYLEERMDQLEREIRHLRSQLKTPPK